MHSLNLSPYLRTSVIRCSAPIGWNLAFQGSVCAVWRASCCLHPVGTAYVCLVGTLCHSPVCPLAVAGDAGRACAAECRSELCSIRDGVIFFSSGSWGTSSLWGRCPFTPRSGSLSVSLPESGPQQCPAPPCCSCVLRWRWYLEIAVVGRQRPVPSVGCHLPRGWLLPHTWETVLISRGSPGWKELSSGGQVCV